MIRDMRFVICDMQFGSWNWEFALWDFSISEYIKLGEYTYEKNDNLFDSIIPQCILILHRAMPRIYLHGRST